MEPNKSRKLTFASVNYRFTLAVTARREECPYASATRIVFREQGNFKSLVKRPPPFIAHRAITIIGQTQTISQQKERESMFAERLKEARKRKGFSQCELARELELHHTEVSKYENRVRQPSIGKLVEIALVLGVSTDYLLGLKDDSDG